MIANESLIPEVPVQARLKILNALAEIRFGSIEITIHEGQVVQIERREKIRMPTSRASE